MMPLTTWYNAGYAVRAQNIINNNHNKCAWELVEKLPRLMDLICYPILQNSNGNYNLLVKISHLFNFNLKNFSFPFSYMCLSSLFFFFKHNIPLRRS